jgi:hypothetical protein
MDQWILGLRSPLAIQSVEITVAVSSGKERVSFIRRDEKRES